MIVHTLHEGLPLCGFDTGAPIDWPDDHSWLPQADFDALTDPPPAAVRCIACVGVRVYRLNCLLVEQTDHKCAGLWRQKLKGLNQ